VRRPSLLLGLLPVLTAIAVVPAPVAHATDATTFQRMAADYEAVRLALVRDSLDGVADAARRMSDLLRTDVDVQAAGVRAGEGDALRSVLPELRAATTALGRAATLEAARESFAALSAAMVRFRALVTDPGPVVAYCSMADRTWLQPEGEIGNPYYGQSMARCGEIVAE